MMIARKAKRIEYNIMRCNFMQAGLSSRTLYLSVKVQSLSASVLSIKKRVWPGLWTISGKRFPLSCCASLIRIKTLEL